jgi:acyl-CoA synthetase (NDP forming)
MLTEYESKKFLEKYKIPVTKCEIAKTKEESLKAAKSIGYPVALKIASADIVHKTEAGGVKLNLKTPEDVARAFTEIVEGAKKYSPKAKIDGVCVEEFVRDGVEVFVGVKRDATFGPTIVFGLGGIFVELLKDTSLRVAPVTEQDVREMITELKGYRILEGFRSGKRGDMESIVDLIKKVGELIQSDDAVLEMDLNPIMVHEEGAGSVVVDARILRR